MATRGNVGKKRGIDEKDGNDDVSARTKELFQSIGEGMMSFSRSTLGSRCVEGVVFSGCLDTPSPGRRQSYARMLLAHCFEHFSTAS